MSSTFLSRDEAAQYVRAMGLPCAKLTLQKYATVGGGPEFQKFGKRVVYTAAALDRWVAERLSAPAASTARAA